MKTKPRLLLVDDEREILEFLSRVFSDCDSETAINADAALELLRKTRFDVLITDIRMPGGTGLSLIHSAKQLWPDLPIIVVTGHYQEMPPDVEQKVYEWILKPFSIETIRQAVRSALHT